MVGQQLRKFFFWGGGIFESPCKLANYDGITLAETSQVCMLESRRRLGVRGRKRQNRNSVF